MKEVMIPMERLPVTAEADICVVGGSCTGVFAAIRAARLGAKVVILEKTEPVRRMCHKRTRLHVAFVIRHHEGKTDYRRADARNAGTARKAECRQPVPHETAGHPLQLGGTHP